ncbi:MAG: polysaccharide pyruvyl transferase family protein [Colwellia sp.]|nr:polysaccharide pyruvyl transferase family protein [Colwellia sp.]
MTRQYVLLTGGKNNAGDHLIRHRAKMLFKWLRPDINIVDLNGWEGITDSQLDVVNGSDALIMTGGPALQNKMYPKVYSLRNNLDDISTPMLSMGIGWYSQKGEWKDTHNYKLDDSSLKLLERINKSGYMSSVRDYHTLNVLHSIGLHNFLMTGCPALYSKEHLYSPMPNFKDIERIAFSLGVTMKISGRMFKQKQDTLLMLKDLFPSAEIDVVFHHSPSKVYLDTHDSCNSLYDVQGRYLSWLQAHDFNYVDISGSASNLIRYYSNVDFHVGYRVHAHIFMSSISKPSIMLNEDGRGKALEKVIGGSVINAYDSMKDALIFRGLRKLPIRLDTYHDYKFLIADLRNMINYELASGVKLSQPRMEIDRHFDVMKKFIAQLP